MPCPCHAPTIAVLPKSTAQHGRLSTAVLWPREERHGRSMAWACRGKCESDTAALCKSNGKDTFQTLSGAAWERHAMCESAIRKPKITNTDFVNHRCRIWTNCIMAAMRMRNLPDQLTGHLSVPKKGFSTSGHFFSKRYFPGKNGNPSV